MNRDDFLHGGGVDDEIAFLFDAFELLLQVERADVIAYPAHFRHGDTTPLGSFSIGSIPHLIRFKRHAR